MSKDIPQGNATYDAATANMGSPWKMPTKDQYEELKAKTTSEWTTIDGVKGRKFTSKSDSTKYIFLRPGGYWRENTRSDSGKWCNYWSTKYGGSDWAWNMYFSYNYAEMGSFDRYVGLSIRPIRHLN